MRVFIVFYHKTHTCQEKGCKATFESMRTASAHVRLYLHMNRTHGTRTNIGCYASCPGIKVTKTRAPRKKKETA